jgi:hypothetical protein
MRNGPWCSVIHLENIYASGAAKRPRGPRSTRTPEPARIVAIQQLPTPDLKTRAMNYFWRHHLNTFAECQDLSKTVCNDFLPIWISKQECALLNLCGSCIALAVFSQTQRHPPAALAASLTYQKLLQATQKSLFSLSEENIEIYLIASFFMGRYEGAIFNPNEIYSTSSRFRSFSHHLGALSILKLWKEQYSHLHPPTDVIRHSRQGLVRSAVLRNAEVPEWMLDGTIFGEHGFDLEYHRIMIQITKIRHQVARLLGDKKLSCRSLDKLTAIVEYLEKEAVNIDNALQEWSSRFPSTWRYGQQQLPDPYPWPMRDFYTPKVWCYSNPAHASVWCNYYSARILINSTRLKIFELGQLVEIADKNGVEAHSNITSMAENLASSIPFCLERFKATVPDLPSEKPLITLNNGQDIKPYVAQLVAWPLTLAAGAGGVDTAQQKWFRCELARVGRIVGYGILESAETDQLPVNNLNFDYEPDVGEY